LARENLACVEAELPPTPAKVTESPGTVARDQPVPAAVASLPGGESRQQGPGQNLRERAPTAAAHRGAEAVKVAIVSFLFNWPTGGGGNIHTAELAAFLQRAGYVVRHFYPRYEPWDIGRVDNLPIDSQRLEFTPAEWTIATIQQRFRQAVDAFAPEYVLL